MVPAAPQIKEVLVTSCTGLLVDGARRPSSEPLALPLTEIFYSEMVRFVRTSVAGTRNGVAYLENAVRLNGSSRDGGDQQ